MIIYIIAMTVLTAISACIAYQDTYQHIALETIAVILCVLGMVGLLAGGVLSIIYYGASYKAEIINREFGTSYTQQEVFYASDVIDTIQQIKRQRVELNGNLMREVE